MLKLSNNGGKQTQFAFTAVGHVSVNRKLKYSESMLKSKP